MATMNPSARRRTSTYLGHNYPRAVIGGSYERQPDNGPQPPSRLSGSQGPYQKISCSLKHAFDDHGYWRFVRSKELDTRDTLQSRLQFTRVKITRNRSCSLKHGASIVRGRDVSSRKTMASCAWGSRISGRNRSCVALDSQSVSHSRRGSRWTRHSWHSQMRNHLIYDPKTIQPEQRPHQTVRLNRRRSTTCPSRR